MGSSEFSAQADRSLQACIGCHDQCMYASADALASGRQELVVSRLASAVRSSVGDSGADARLTDALFMSLDQGSQQRACIILDGSQDPRTWLREARRGAMGASGHIPVPVAELRAARSAARPTGPDATDACDYVVVSDSVTGSRDTRGTSALVGLLALPGARVGRVTLGSAGTLEHLYGLDDECEQQADAARRALAPWGSAVLVSDDPAICWASRHLWGPTSPRVVHVAEHLATRTDLVPGSPSEGRPTRVVVNDVGLLAGDLGVVDPIRSVLGALGHDVVEPPSTGTHAREDGPMFGYPDTEVVTALGRARYRELAGTGADLIVTVAPWSRYNLERHGDVPVITLSEAVARALAGAPQVEAGR